MEFHLVEMGTNALGLLGQTNRLINNKWKEFHKQDLDTKYHYLTSANFPYTDNLYGDDINKNIKEIQDMNRLNKNVGWNVGRVIGQRGYVTWGYNRGRTAYPSYARRDRMTSCRQAYGRPVQQTVTTSTPKNSKMGPKKMD